MKQKHYLHSISPEVPSEKPISTSADTDFDSLTGRESAIKCEGWFSHNENPNPSRNPAVKAEVFNDMNMEGE